MYQDKYSLYSPIEPGWRLDYIAMPKGKFVDKARDEKNISMMKIWWFFRTESVHNKNEVSLNRYLNYSRSPIQFKFANITLWILGLLAAPINRLKNKYNTFIPKCLQLRCTCANKNIDNNSSDFCFSTFNTVVKSSCHCRQYLYPFNLQGADQPGIRVAC